MGMRSIRRKPTKREYLELLDRIRGLEAERSELRTLVDNYRTMLAKLQIDFNSYRKRVERDRELDRAMAAERIIRELLPILDNLEYAINASLNSSNDGGGIADGVRMILRQLLSVLSKEGLEVVPTVGNHFDPSIHEAVEVVSVENEEDDGKVVLEIRKGYTLGGRVIRPALVKVGRKG